MKQRRNTIAKTEVLAILTNSDTALSHSEIQKKLDGLCDRVTTYRILDRLLEEDTIHKISDVDGTVKYAVCHDCSVSAHHHNHIHFSCEKCHQITCLETVEPTFILPSNYQIREVNFTVSGICPNCLQ